MSALWIGFLVAAATMPPPVQGSFCERLAGQTGMAAEHAKPGETPHLWSTRMFNLAQRFLVGGQATVTMQMAPAANANAADYARLGEACRAARKGVACAIDGPAEFRMGINGKEARATAGAGEKAQVEMIGSRVTCRDR